MQTQLSLLDRVILESSIIPREENFEKIIISRQIKDKASITSNEIDNFNIRSNERGLLWENKGKDGIESKTYKISIDFTELEEKLISENLKKLDENKKLTEDHIDLYRIFVSKPKQEVEAKTTA